MLPSNITTTENILSIVRAACEITALIMNQLLGETSLQELKKKRLEELDGWKGCEKKIMTGRFGRFLAELRKYRAK